MKKYKYIISLVLVVCLFAACSEKEASNQKTFSTEIDTQQESSLISTIAEVENSSESSLMVSNSETLETWSSNEDELLNSTLPIEENEVILIQTESNILAFNQAGKLIQKLDGAVIFDQTGKLMQNFDEESSNVFIDVLIIDFDQPIPISIKMEDGEYKAGLYSLRETRWLLEPIYDRLCVLSSTLCTDSENLVAFGTLMKSDGSILLENVGHCVRMGDYVFSYTSNGMQIWDLQGAILSESQDTYTVLDVWGQQWIGYSFQNQQYIFQDVNGAVVWTQAGNWNFLGGNGEYFSWKDENQDEFITDLQLNIVPEDSILLENDFLTKEEEWNWYHISTEIQCKKVESYIILKGTLGEEYFKFQYINE